MNTKTMLMVALSYLAANTASAGTNTWTTGWRWVPPNMPSTTAMATN